MAKFQTFNRDEVEGSAEHPQGRDWKGLTTAKLLSPEGYPLWLVDATLEDGATLVWDGEHSDEGVYVQSGELTVDGRRCPAGGAVLVESNAPAVIKAVGETHVAHTGAVETVPPPDGPFGEVKPDGHSVHVIGPTGTWRSGSLEGVHAIWFADSACDTCRAAFFTVSSPDAHEGPAHTHTQDEIIYLLGGGIRMGATTYGAGTTLCIPGEMRYKFRGEEGGHRFLNWRRGTSFQTNVGSPTLIETPEGRAGVYVGDVR
jgi:hypothetical protein